jgi:hypothetical protein
MKRSGRDRTFRAGEAREGTAVKTVEKDNASTRSRGLCTDNRDDDQCKRAIRFFRDHRGTDHDCNADLVFVHDAGSHAASDDDVQWRHWAVVCTER